MPRQEKRVGSRIIKDFASRINELGYYKRANIVEYLFKSGKIEAAQAALKKGNASTDPFYESFIGLTGIGDQTRLRAETFLTGTYQFWRYSSSMPGFLVKGMLQIGKSSDERFGRESTSTLQTGTIRYLGSHSSSRRALLWLCLQTAWGRCILLVTQPGSHHIRFAILTESSFNKSREADGMKIVLMTGMVMGVDSARNFVSPLYVERVSDATGFCRDEAIRKLKDSLNLYSEIRTPTCLSFFAGIQSSEILSIREFCSVATDPLR